MKGTLQVNTNPAVENKFDSYPEQIREKLLYLRKIVLDAATKIDSIQELEETLKWGEPSFLVKKGSTIRMDWKLKKPDQYAIYFKCTSKLVPTFKEIYSDTFSYEKTRAIVFGIDDEVPVKKLTQCVQAALMYHTVKNLPLLGMKTERK